VKYLPLIWKSLWRRKVRTTFTLLSIFIAFLLFGVLMTIRAAFSLGIDLAGLDRTDNVAGRLMLTPTKGGWKVFGFDVSREEGAAR